MKKKILIILLIVIGIVGFAYFWITYFGSIFNRDLNNPVFNYNMTKTTKMQLEQVIEEIEKYNKENGHYPINLEFLLESKKPLQNPYDIFCTGTSKHGTYLQYQVTEENTYFFLFSVGSDLIPFSDDDVFFEKDKLNFESGYRERSLTHQP